MQIFADPRERSGYLLAAPTVVFLVVFFVVPSLILLVFSFWSYANFTITPGLSLGNYVAAATRPAALFSTWTGLKIGFFAGIAATVLSFPVAWYIAFRARGNGLLYIVLVSWFSSYLVRIFAWRTILGTKGLINSALMSAGLISEPLGFLVFSPTAVVITLTHIFVPFTLLLLLSALRNVSVEYIHAGRDLGCTSFQVLTRIVMPIAYKGIVGAFMFTFILSAGDYITPQLLGGRGGVTIGFLISDQFRVTGNWPLGAAMAFFLLAVFLFVYFLVAQGFAVARLAPGRRYHRPMGDRADRPAAPAEEA